MPAAAELSNKNGAVNGQQTAVTEELAAIWKRMCSPRGVVKEFENLKAGIATLAGSTGVAEYYRILRQHGVDHPRDSRRASRHDCSSPLGLRVHHATAGKRLHGLALRASRH